MRFGCGRFVAENASRNSPRLGHLRGPVGRGGILIPIAVSCRTRGKEKQPVQKFKSEASVQLIDTLKMAELWVSSVMRIIFLNTPLIRRIPDSRLFFSG